MGIFRRTLALLASGLIATFALAGASWTSVAPSGACDPNTNETRMVYVNGTYESWACQDLDGDSTSEWDILEGYSRSMIGTPGDTDQDGDTDGMVWVVGKAADDNGIGTWMIYAMEIEGAFNSGAYTPTRVSYSQSTALVDWTYRVGKTWAQIDVGPTVNATTYTISVDENGTGGLEEALVAGQGYVYLARRTDEDGTCTGTEDGKIWYDTTESELQICVDGTVSSVDVTAN